MTEISEQAQFQSRATGSNPVLIEGDRFEVVVTDHDGNRTQTMRPDRVRFSPAVNAAKDLSVRVPPSQFLEGLQFIGGDLELYLNSTLLFEGEIQEIDTNQNHDPYSINAKSPGKKLAGEAIDQEISNEVVLDFIAETVDEYSGFDANHTQLVGTDDETFNNVIGAGGNTRRVSDGFTSGTVTYSGVGPSAQDIELLRIKCYTPGVSTIDVEIATDDNSYTDTISSADQNRYGEWVSIDPSGTFGGDDNEYDIIFTIKEQSILSYWISMNELLLDRIVHTPDVTDTDSGVDIYEKYPTLDEDDNRRTRIVDSDGESDGPPPNVGSGAIYDQSINGGNGGWRPRQKTAMNIPELGGINVVDDSDNGAIGTGGAITIGVTGAGHAHLDRTLTDFNIREPIEGWEIWARIRFDPDLGTNPRETWAVSFTIDGTENSYGLGGSIHEHYTWTRIASHDFTPDWPETLEELDLGLTGIKTIPDHWVLGLDPNFDPDEHQSIEPTINALAIVHGDDSSYDFNYEFDNTPDANNQISSPHIYASNNTFVETKPYADRENIGESTTTVGMDDPSGATDNWGPKQRVDETAPYPDDAPNSNTITNQYSYPGIGHQVRIEIPASGSRTGASPTEGFRPTRAWSIDVNGTHNDLPVLGSIDVSDNRLGAISSIADEHDTLFRWEGSLCRIFDRGEFTVDPDLREADISSSVSIKDVYERVKVKGLHNANSGWIVAESAPDYVDDKKLIEDPSLEIDASCVAKAKSFIRKHGNVKFAGSISTVATFAPVGALIDGNHFNHGQSMIIKDVSYSRDSSSINLGLDKNIATELIGISTSNKKEETRVTRNKMKVPSGEDAFE